MSKMKKEVIEMKEEFKCFINEQDVPKEDYERMEEICSQPTVSIQDLLEVYCRGFQFYGASARHDEES